jgi:hypothetical protein
VPSAVLCVERTDVRGRRRARHASGLAECQPPRALVWTWRSGAATRPRKNRSSDAPYHTYASESVLSTDTIRIARVSNSHVFIDCQPVPSLRFEVINL